MLDQYSYLIHVLSPDTSTYEVSQDKIYYSISFGYTKQGGQDDVVDQMLEELEDKKIKVEEGETIYSDTILWGFDSIHVMQQKIAQITNIPPFRQYLSFNLGSPITHNLYPDISGPNASKIDLQFQDEVDKISHIPIWTNLSNLDQYYVMGSEYSTMLYTISNQATNELYLVDLYDYYNPSSSFDDYTKSLIYSGFARLYWPISKDVFLNITQTDLEDAFAALYDYKTIDFGDRFKILTQSDSSHIQKDINNIIRYIEFIVYSPTQIGTTNMFNIIKLDETIPIIRIVEKVKSRLLYITKVYTGVDYSHLYLQYKKSFYVSRNDIVLLYRSGKQVYSIIITNRYYKIQVFTPSNKFSNIKSLTIKHITDFIEFINSFGYYIFTTEDRLVIPTTSNLIINKLSSSSIFPISISKGYIESFNTFIRNNMGSLSYISSWLNSSEYLFDLDYNPNVMSYMQKNLGEYYDYQSNITSRELFDTYYPRSYQLVVNYSGYLTVLMEDIDININTLIMRIFSDLLDNFKLEVKTSNVDYRSLKKMDPNLYDFSQYGTDKRPGRLCQKKFQPIALPSEQYQKLSDKEKKGYVKYWNFTTNTPLYYKCPNPDIPYLGFLVKHPKGYCLPCCGKKKHKPGSKKANIYQKCMQNLVFDTEEDQDSTFKRYIMNYNRSKIEKGRMYQLPDKLHDSLTSYSYIESAEQDRILINNIRYPITSIFNLIARDKVYTIKVSRHLYFLDDYIPNKHVTYSELLNDASLSPTYYSKIQDADLDGIALMYKGKVVYGLEILAKAYISGASAINIKRLNENILKRSRNILINVQYYLYIPDQEYNLMDLGMLYSLAVIFNEPADTILDEIVQALSNRDFILEQSIMGMYSGIYTSIRELISSFLYDIQADLPSGTDWNPLVARVVKHIRNISIVTILYTHTYHLDLNGDSTLRETACFLLQDKGYFPILYTSSKNFLNNITKSIYSDSDIIYTFFQDIIRDLLVSFTDLFFQIFADYIQYLFMLNNVLVYGAGIKYKDTVFQVPLEYYELVGNYQTYRGYIKRSDITYTYKQFKEFVLFHNEMIIAKSEELGRFKYKAEGAREDKVVPVLPLIKVDEYLEYNNQIIGIRSDKLYYYFQGDQVLDVSEHFQAKPDITRNNSVKVLLYDPDTLNEALKRPVIVSPEPEVYKKSIYKRYIFMLASMDLLHSLIKDKKLDDLLKISKYDDLYSQLDGLARRQFYIGEPDLGQDYRIVKCGIKKSLFCKGKKLALREDLVPIFIKGFIQDIKNPVKLKIIEDNIFIYALFDKYEFRKYPDEQIYVKSS